MDFKIKCPHCEFGLTIYGYESDNIDCINIGQECFECKGQIDVKQSYIYMAEKFKSLANTFAKKAFPVSPILHCVIPESPPIPNTPDLSDISTTVDGLPGKIRNFDSPKSPDSTAS